MPPPLFRDHRDMRQKQVELVPSRPFAPLGLVVFAAISIYLRHEAWVSSLAGDSRRAWRTEMLTWFFFAIVMIAPTRILWRRGASASESLWVGVASLACAMTTYWLFGWVWGA